ncbi:MAG: type II toxin-antitoxin system RelE/ParE family toxin [Burkholderiales bacterium]|nr:type II toxin-antitoxin system RelE/ParE family toxin [Burkholderiales bacterium]
MVRIELAPELGEDLDRIFDHLAEHDVENIPSRIEEIMQAISVLESNPLIGRPVCKDMRELIIGRRSRGYVALYRYVAEIDAVFVLALRGQREAGYSG